MKMPAVFALFSMCVFAAAPTSASAERIPIESLKELDCYAAKSGNTIEMKPGVYKLVDYISLEEIAQRREASDWHFIEFRGSDNVFDLTGVTIEVDTTLRSALRAPVHNPEFLVSGDGNVIKGVTITNIGEGTSSGGNILSIRGDGNTLHEATFHVRGSKPYGYGDLMGKGGRGLMGLRKHSGVQITGNKTRVIGSRLYMQSFGHGFYIQNGATDTQLEDCYVEGEMRRTDDMLAETSGPLCELGFRMVYRNRKGERRIAPGYMKSLAEDAFRTYAGVRGVTLINCTSKNMRAGYELRNSSPVLENCVAIGNERGFWVGDNAVIRDSRGDAKYGPLLFLEGSNAMVDLALMPAESQVNVHALATIHGKGHKVTIKPWKGQQRGEPVPIRLGFSQPSAGEGMSPYGKKPAVNIHLENETHMPVIISDHARGRTGSE